MKYLITLWALVAASSAAWAQTPDWVGIWAAKGDTYDETTMVKVDRYDPLWRWYSVGNPIRFTRCKEYTFETF